MVQSSNHTLYARWVVSSSVDVTESAPAITIYPIPVRDELRIAGENINKVEIMDISGRIINNLQITINNSIDVSALSKGIYIVRIGTDKGVVTKKFIKE